MVVAVDGVVDGLLLLVAPSGLLHSCHPPWSLSLLVVLGLPLLDDVVAGAGAAGHLLLAVGPPGILLAAYPPWSLSPQKLKGLLTTQLYPFLDRSHLGMPELKGQASYLCMLMSQLYLLPPAGVLVPP